MQQDEQGSQYFNQRNAPGNAYTTKNRGRDNSNEALMTRKNLLPGANNQKSGKFRNNRYSLEVGPNSYNQQSQQAGMTNESYSLS